MDQKLAPSADRIGIVACGALARELETVRALPGFAHVTVRYLPAGLHNSPQDISAAVDTALSDLGLDCSGLFVAYADCGTGGALDRVIDKHGAERLPGAHCYAFFAGLDRFDALQEAEPGTFYLTDFLARQFDTLVWKPLGLDRHPELLSDYFGYYTRLMYLAQSDDANLTDKARSAANRLGLRFERIETGLGGLVDGLASLRRDRRAA